MLCTAKDARIYPGVSFKKITPGVDDFALFCKFTKEGTLGSVQTMAMHAVPHHSIFISEVTGLEALQ
jgi:hypothetical protein